MIHIELLTARDVEQMREYVDRVPQPQPAPVVERASGHGHLEELTRQNERLKAEVNAPPDGPTICHNRQAEEGRS